MKNVLIGLGIVALVLVVMVGGIVGIYNRLVSYNESIQGYWAEVENQLQRRNDLIPNLVNSVKGYAKHEKDVFTYVADARAKLAGARTVNEKIAASQQLDGALSRLLMVVEQYPQLKANENFIRLQDELAGTENRIAVARQRYNEIVLAYNITLKRFPGNIIAAFFNFEKKDVYYKAPEAAKAVPQVQF